MLISEETKIKMNELIGEFFGNNSEADNLAYNLAYAGYPLISEIYHHSMAHFFTGDTMADGASGFLDLLDARAIRIMVPANDADYGGNLSSLFADNAIMCENCRAKIIDVIELAELNGDYEVKIWGEELLMKFLPYYKQARVWAEFAKRYEGDYKSFEVHFEDLTTYIPVVK